MKLRILFIASIVMLVLSIVLTILYLLGNPGGFYTKSDGFLPSIEYSSEMEYYVDWTGNFDSSKDFEVVITTTDREANVCVLGTTTSDKDLVTADFDKLEKVKFSVAELENISTITLDGYSYSINDEGVLIYSGSTEGNYANSTKIAYNEMSIEMLSSMTFYYTNENPSKLYSAEYINNSELTPYFRVIGFFDLNMDDSTLEITMLDDIDDASLDEAIQIELPFQFDKQCEDVAPNSTYVIDNTGGHYAEQN